MSLFGPRMPDEGKTIAAPRILTGTCPECGQALAVFNWREVWPLVYCPCSHVFPTTDLDGHHRVETGLPRL